MEQGEQQEQDAGRRTAPLASTTPRRVSTVPVSRNMARQQVRAARASRIILLARSCIRADVCGRVKEHPGPFLPSGATRLC